MPEQRDWKEVFDGLVLPPFEGLSSLDGPPQHLGVVDDSLVEDDRLS